MNIKIKIKDPFSLYLRQKQRKNIPVIEKKQIEDLFKEILPSVNLNLFGKKKSIDVELVIKHLFFLCLITDRLELAKIFWKMGKVFLEFS
jgi:hypothetical protein